MRVLATVALLVLVPALAGCLEPDPRPVSSNVGRDSADAVARRWDDDAVLVGLAAVDPGPGTMQEFEDDLEVAEQELEEGRADGSLDEEEESELEGQVKVLRALIAAGPSAPGDGRAALWTHVYVNEEGEGYVVTVSDDRLIDARPTALEGEEDDDDALFGSEGDAPLGTWRIDSVEAAAAARDADETYSDLAGGDNVTAFMALLREAEDEDDMEGEGLHAYWLLVLDPNDGRDGVFLLVDAENGTVVSLSALLQDLFLGRESGSETGRFAAAIDETASASFQLERAHGNLAVRLDLRPPPPEPVTATLTLPDGSTRTWEVGFDAAAAAGESVRLEGVVPGEYAVELSAPLVPFSDWTLSWCTDGMAPFGFFFSEPACSDLDSA